MSYADVIAVLPLVILGASSILTLLATAFIRRPAFSFAVSLTGMITALACVIYSWRFLPRHFTSFLSLDRFSLFAVGLVLAASIIAAASAIGDLRKRVNERGEYFFFLTTACLGASVLAAAGNFPALFLGLELLSVSLFTLISYRLEHVPGSEAGIKYLVLAGVASAFLLFGMALVYHELGSMALSKVASEVSGGGSGFLFLTGLGLMAVGIGFKLAVVPFHFWTPDIYDGAPSHVAGFLATVSKGATAVILVRLFGWNGVAASPALRTVFIAIAGATMIVGNLLALREGNVKRILAYSSIAHFGYLLVAFIAGGTPSVLSVSFFLTAYFASTLAAFSSVTALSGASRDADRIDDYRGLAGRKPWLAACFTISLLSLAGLPLTSGFMGKFVLLAAGEGALLWGLAVLLVVNSAISLFYYLKIISAMYVSPGAGGAASPTGRISVPITAGLAIAIATIAVLVLGVYPAPLMRLMETFIAGG
jgi:NADH-quinone oxidoreductase subunit N